MKNVALIPPEWLSRSAIYQVNPRTFSKDGTIKAIMDELPFLKELGFGVIYLCPIFKEDVCSDQNSWSTRQKASGTNNPKNPYRINDYFSIDEEYGTLEDLQKFTHKAHELEMKVIFDLVYAHIGPEASIIKRHPEFVMQNADGSFVTTEWNFPALDFKCEGLREYLYCNMVYYVAVCDVDGFRCDVGDAVPIDFWKEAKRRITEVKPDCVLINEGSKFENQAIAFDVTYTFDWHEALYKIFCEGESAKLLQQQWETYHGLAPLNALLLRDIDNHDTVTDWPARTESAASHEGMEQIITVNYLIDGVPMVYTGNEIADTARISMFANRFYPGNFEVTDRNAKSTTESLKRQETIKILNILKKESDVLRYGETIWLDDYCSDNIIAFKRRLGNHEIVFIGNTRNEPCEISLKHIPENILLGTAKKSGGNLFFEPYRYIVFSIKNT